MENGLSSNIAKYGHTIIDVFIDFTERIDTDIKIPAFLVFI